MHLFEGKKEKLEIKETGEKMENQARKVVVIVIYCSFYFIVF